MRIPLKVSREPTTDTSRRDPSGTDPYGYRRHPLPQWQSKRRSLLPPASRTKDIRSYPYLRSPGSRGLWRFLTYRFTRVSWWFFLVMLLFMGYGANSLEIQSHVTFTYFFSAWLIAIVGALFYRPKVKLEWTHGDRLRVGETLPARMELEQLRRRFLSELNIVPHCLPPSLDSVPAEGVGISMLKQGEKTHFEVGIKCNKRGLHRWDGFRVESDFPFSLFRSYRLFYRPCSIMVYPRFDRLVQLALPVGRSYQPGGVAMASIIGESYEYLGNREFREGDNLRNMDWRATARLQVPIVREYREEYFLRVGVVLDTYLPRSAPLSAEEDFERAVSISAAVSDYLARSDYIVDIFAAGPKLYHLTAGRSLAYLDQILEILACVEANPEEPFETLEPAIVEHLAQITSIICIFTDWNEARRQFTQNLKQEGTGLKVIVVRDMACTLDIISNSDDITIISAADFKTGIDTI